MPNTKKNTAFKNDFVICHQYVYVHWNNVCGSKEALKRRLLCLNLLTWLKVRSVTTNKHCSAVDSCFLSALHASYLPLLTKYYPGVEEQGKSEMTVAVLCVQTPQK